MSVARASKSAILTAALVVVSPLSARPIVAQEIESGVIRLAAPAGGADAERRNAAPAREGLLGSGERRGFDYEAFGARFESLWFHRKAYLADGRSEEALRQAELIRSFVAEEGVRRLESPAGALVAEAERYLRDGNHPQALAALHLGESLDPVRPQIRFLRARVLWESGAGVVAALAETVRGVRASLSSVISDPSRLQPFALVVFAALMVICGAFSGLMAIRYHSPLRHEVEEWMAATGRGDWAVPAGWAILLLPLLTWIAAGWIFFYWIVVTFRFMRRSERVVAGALLLSVALSTPLYRTSVALYGRTADPRIRTTFAAANGEYDPELIVRLRDLVEAEPNDATYRFLLGGLYKDGRFFEEAFEEYKRVLALDPTKWQAYVNIGNLYLQMGQYGEAIAQYRRALDIRPDALPALMNTYHAQTESFRLNEAAHTLELARRVDGAEVARLLSTTRSGAAASGLDATLDARSVWGKVLEGAEGPDWIDSGSGAERLGSFASQAVSPAGLFALLAAGAAVAMLLGMGPVARRCSRCGRPFCRRCKSGKDAPEYCTHCVHLFVLGDGLARGTKSRKLYEIEAHARRMGLLRRAASALLPGSGDVLTGRTGRGILLCAVWITALLILAPSAFRPLESWLGLQLHLDVVPSVPVPPAAHVEPAAMLAIPLLALAWLVSNLPGVARRGEA